jgi:hypothetical protein
VSTALVPRFVRRREHREVRTIGSCVTVCFLLLAGCTSDDRNAAPDSVASVEATGSEESPASPTPAPAETLSPEPGCAGLGRVPARGQITYVENGELRAAAPSGEPARCLVDVGSLVEGPPAPPVWNGPANRVLLGNRALSRDGSLTRRLTGTAGAIPQWSRPAGTSVVYITRAGALMKRSSYGGAATDISFLDRHDAVTYHPAGEHIATSGLGEEGDYGLYLATNIGTEPQLIARGEAARFITNLRFTQDGRHLYYVARHGPFNWHLHRLRIGEDASLETLAMEEAGFEYVVSPFDGDVFAWFVPGDCAAGTNGRFEAPERDLRLSPELESRNIRPIGWLPSGSLVVRAETTGCSTAQPADVYVLSDDNAPILVREEDYGGVSVRVRIPPPPPPPGEEQEVVA